MKKALALVITTATLLTPSVSAVTQKFNFDLNAQHSRGQQTLQLKKMIKNKYGRKALQGFKLKKVTISAKSKKGGADANLQVGYKETYPQTISGTPENFDSHSSGYSSLSFMAPRGSQRAQGQWKLHIKGNVKVDSVSAVTKMQPSYNYESVGRFNFQHQKSFKVAKIVGSSEKINVGSGFKAIQISASGKSVSITEVKVKFKDGQVVTLEEMKGKVKGTKSFKFKHELGKPIKFIKVSAVSNNLFGSRGKLHIKTATGPNRRQ
ncbi:hypothetical protein A9Q84_01630 [Halobacteriovorax marinus]|uniref:Secreted protein n=1 Tax=Halobacteriovorax marinus TaxID=97084 RepID=A0A1Y5FC22_9BACT|nr:hypothetical protein A9Q84_01630 [Halobacteriovorax marinus]